MIKLIKNFIKYQLSKLPNRIFIDNSNGAIYETGSVMGYFYGSFVHALLLNPSITTESEEALRPGLGASTLILTEYKDMENFTYVGKL